MDKYFIFLFLTPTTSTTGKELTTEIVHKQPIQKFIKEKNAHQNTYRQFL